MDTWKEQIPQRHTLLELTGQNRLLIEVHRGILGYSGEEILVGADYGQIRVQGTDLRLCSMSREQLLIRGTIQRISPEGREK